MIQPFDGGKFDKRFDAVLKPAVTGAGLDPYRVDRDPGASIPIDQIEVGIRQAALCLADITSDNPNVWFELGYAIAVGKDICLICSEERTTKYPFDVQHRNIIRYSTDAPQDFAALADKITARLNALLQKQEATAIIPQVSKDEAGLTGLREFEISCIAVLGVELAGLNDTLSAYRLRKAMEKLGYTNLASNVAVRQLKNRRLIESFNATDDDGSTYEVYGITDAGWAWIDENIHHLNVAYETRRKLSEDEIPF
ncbi:hypothetical protein [Hyphomicrobium sp.]|uniref:hypothetical protein n=1 Tax=Hyphomicrobium sp. TaxID=82 RepID=UPI00132A0B1E|nr:hypothetical protein [Hyphomicrobium sp.]KAB2937044.1 MAG: hypothetical protein F9K20_20575 [Hyphomicrobium sp.]